MGKVFKLAAYPLIWNLFRNTQKPAPGIFTHQIFPQYILCPFFIFMHVFILILLVYDIHKTHSGIIVALFLYHICCFGFAYKPNVDQNLKVVQ